MTTLVVLFLLAVVWGIYLISWFRGRTQHRNVNSISSFNKHLSVLERTSPGRVGPVITPSRGSTVPLYAPIRRQGMTRSEARRRRRDVLFALGGAVLVTLMLAVVVGGPFVVLQLLADVALGAYVFLLVRNQQMAAERQTKVRYLAGPAMSADAAFDGGYPLARSASAN